MGHGLNLYYVLDAYQSEALVLKILVIGTQSCVWLWQPGKQPRFRDTLENEGGYRSYASIAARFLLGSRIDGVQLVGPSMLRNRQLNYDKVATIPKIFNQTLLNDATIVWDHFKCVADVAVINLGTNVIARSLGKKGPHCCGPMCGVARKLMMFDT